MPEPAPLNIQFADQAPPTGDQGLQINFLDQAPQGQYQPRLGHGLSDAITTGWQSSATGLAARGKLPDVVLDSQHAKWWEKLTSTATQMGAEAPEMIAGSAAGGAAGAAVGSAAPVVGTVIGSILGAGAGAFAVPTALRTALMERYSNGEVHSVSDFLNRTAIVTAAGLKEGTVGAITAGTGLAAKPLGALAAKGAEIAAMTASGAALQGKLPEPADFLNAAIMVGGMHMAGAVAGRMRDVYAKTGITPEQQVADAHANPEIAADLRGESETSFRGVKEIGQRSSTGIVFTTPEERVAQDYAGDSGHLVNVVAPKGNRLDLTEFPSVAKEEDVAKKLDEAFGSPEATERAMAGIKTDTSGNFDVYKMVRSKAFLDEAKAAGIDSTAFNQLHGDDTSHVTYAYLDESKLVQTARGQSDASTTVKWDPSSWPEANPDMPRAYQPVADAQAVQDAVPGLAGEVAKEFFGPRIKISDEPQPTQVNYQYLNTPSQVDGALVKISQLNEEAIQTQRRGVVGWTASEAQGEQVLRDMLGVDSSVPLRKIGEASNAAQLWAMKQLVEGAANDMATQAKKFADLGANASPEDTAAFLGSIDRCALIQQQFLGARAEAGRALQILQNTTEAAGRAQLIQGVLDQFGKDPAKLAEMMKNIDSAEGAARFARKVSKATTWDMVMEGWKAGLLGPVTVIKKSLSDITMMASRPIVDSVAYGFNRLTGAEQQMSAVEPLARVIGNLKGASEGLTQAWEVLKSEAPAEGVTENFKHAIPGMAGTVIRTPFRAIEAVTQLFNCMEQRGEAYAQGARQAAAEGLDPLTHEFSDRVAELAINPSESTIDQMEAFGKRMTFGSDLGEFGRNFRKVVNTTGPGGVAPLQVVFPFLKAPLNVFQESARLSPLAPMVGDWRADFAEGGIARSKAVAEAAIGTALTGLGLAWAASGKITGSGDPDPAKRRIAQAAGWQPYSIKLGDKWYSYRMIHPVGTLLGMTADIHEMSHLMDAGEGDKAGRVAADAFAHAVTEQTFLQGMSTLVKALDAPEKQGTVFLQNLVASAVPATVTQTSALIHADPYKRQIDSIKDAVQARIPGWREQLPVQRDPWGEPIANDERVGGVSPILEKQPSTDLVRTEAARLGVGAQAAPHSIQLPSGGVRDLGKVELSSTQRDVFGDVAGHLAYSVMQPLVNSPAWENMPDLVKQKAYQMALEKANSVGKATVLTPEDRQAKIQQIVAGISRRLIVVK